MASPCRRSFLFFARFSCGANVPFIVLYVFLRVDKIEHMFYNCATKSKTEGHTMDERKELIEKIIALLEQADDIQLRMIYYMLLNKH